MTPRTAYLLAGATVAAGALVLSGVRVLMALGGLPLAVVLPGLALTALLSGRPGRLSTVERIVLAPALSLGTVVLGGLLAWAVRAPLHRVTWLALTAGVTLAGLAAVSVRDRRGASATSVPGVRGRGPRPLAALAPAALAVLLLAGATWLSLATSIRSHDVTVTTLSVAPPGPADATGDRGIRVEATGLSPGVRAYTLTVTSASVHTSTPVTADGAGRWTATLRLPGEERLTLTLARTGAAAPARRVLVAAG